MASQITHVVYGNKVKNKYLSGRKLDEKRYYLGNLFPDIRYLKVISREKTHRKDPVVSKLQKFKNPFQLGIYTHALVDWEREKALAKFGMYQLVNKEPITATALKLIEDEVNYPLFDNWPEIISFLDDILEEETNLAPKPSVQKWHNMLKDYFSRKKKAKGLMSEIGFSEDVANAVISKMSELRKNHRVIKIVKNIYDEIL